MPPRFVYWTILIDGKPTAFRARDREELLPTLNQLKRTNADVTMLWFAHGRLWASPEAEREAASRPTVREKRGRDWRPGGDHKDPRARFDKKKSAKPRRDNDRERPADGPRRPFAPRAEPPFGKRPAFTKPRAFDGKPPDGNRPHDGRPPVRRPYVAPPREDRPLFASRAGGHRPPPRGKDDPGRRHGEGDHAPAPSKSRGWKPKPPKRR
jgi:hypothetical protein